jgi:hypothetical protein
MENVLKLYLFVQSATFSIAHFEKIGSVSVKISFKSSFSNMELVPKNHYLTKFELLKSLVGKNLYNPIIPDKR